jgi:hypothetical protein
MGLASAPGRWLLLTTQGKNATFNSELADSQTASGGFAVIAFPNLNVS